MGLEAVAIVSAMIGPLTVHVNGGGGLDRDDRHGFAVWGLIGELPVHPRLRVVGEVNGENIQNQRANDSALLGVIWQPAAKNLFFDAAVRRGMTHAAADWQFTLGLTFGFAVPTRQSQ